jgi:uncharacterized spore protein YtfJ
MKVEEILQKARDAVDIHQVFGEPYRQDGLTIIPVARVTGGGGGGQRDPQEGSGIGYGFRAEPAGVYVIRGDKVKWEPAINVNAVIAGSFLVAIVAIRRVPRMIKQGRKLFA